MAKIAIVGAGSVEFTRNIVADLSSWPELRSLLVGEEGSRFDSSWAR